jgi:hypothetical protein
MKYLIPFIFILFASFNSVQENDAFTFKDGKKSITIELETQLKYFELNKPTKFKVRFENIDLKRTAISGRGISVLHNERGDNFITCIVTVTEDSLKDGNFIINVRYETENKDNRYQKFILPVK